MTAYAEWSAVYLKNKAAALAGRVLAHNTPRQRAALYAFMVERCPYHGGRSRAGYTARQLLDHSPLTFVRNERGGWSYVYDSGARIRPADDFN